MPLSATVFWPQTIFSVRLEHTFLIIGTFLIDRILTALVGRCLLHAHDDDAAARWTLTLVLIVSRGRTGIMRAGQ